MLQSLKWLALGSIYLSLISCSSVTEQSDNAPSLPRDVSNIPNAVPKDESRMQSHVMNHEVNMVIQQVMMCLASAITPWLVVKVIKKKGSHLGMVLSFMVVGLLVAKRMICMP